jgi:ComF family protein
MQTLIQRLANGARQTGQLILDALLPPQCLSCDATVDAPGRFCLACFRRASFVTEPCCAACGVPFSHAGLAGPEHLCPGCSTQRPPWGRARGALRYDAHARGIVLPFKHGDRTEHAGALAQLMLRAGAHLLRDADLLVPVPLHRSRLRTRRYNQAALLARAIGRLSGHIVLPDALIRIRATRPLGELSAEERAATVKDVFAIRQTRAPRIAGHHILLIDDVMTSGATSAACTRILLAAGATVVDVLVAARVPDPRLQ